MSESDWQGAFWVGLIICIIAAMVLGGVVGFWWKEIGGMFVGFATVLIAMVGTIVVIAYRSSYGRRNGRNE